MPRRAIGLGASTLDEDDIDGDIDFDFFDDDGALTSPRLIAPRTADRPSAATAAAVPASRTQPQQQDELSQATLAGEQQQQQDEEDGGAESETSLDVTVSDSSSGSSSSSEDEDDDSLDDGEDEEGPTDSDIFTDVTPLSSANQSPLPASPDRCFFQQQQQPLGVTFASEPRRDSSEPPSSPSSGAASEERREASPSPVDGRSVDLKILVQAILEMEQQQQRKKQQQQLNAGGRQPERPLSARLKKNMSFSNDDVRRIDRENQLLLKKILDKQHCRRAAEVHHHHHHPPRPRTASSAVNRHRHQKRVEAENMVLLKRIQSAKPTRELSRAHLMKSGHPRPASSSLRSGSQASLSRNGASADAAAASPLWHRSCSWSGNVSPYKSVVDALKGADVPVDPLELWHVKC